MVTRDKINILDKLLEAIGIAKASSISLEQFRFTGDTTEVDFLLPAGWKPKMVFGTAGDLKLEGATDDYTYSSQHDIYTVTFSAAPAASDFVILGER